MMKTRKLTVMSRETITNLIQTLMKKNSMKAAVRDSQETT